jgi:hypothetical protein
MPSHDDDVGDDEFYSSSSDEIPSLASSSGNGSEDFDLDIGSARARNGGVPTDRMPTAWGDEGTFHRPGSGLDRTARVGSNAQAFLRPWQSQLYRPTEGSSSAADAVARGLPAGDMPVVMVARSGMPPAVLVDCPLRRASETSAVSTFADGDVSPGNGDTELPARDSSDHPGSVQPSHDVQAATVAVASHNVVRLRLPSSDACS